MSISDIISIVSALISLIVAIIIAIVQFRLDKRMEKLALKQDQEQKRAVAQRIKAERDSFIMKYYNDEREIYMLPLCWIASIYDPAHAYHRNMYMEYNMLEEDVQQAICQYMDFNVEKPKIEREDFYSKCVKALQDAENRESVFPHPRTILYDNAKYLRRAYERYGSQKLPIPLFQLEHRLSDLLRDYREDAAKCPNPLESFLKETHFYSMETEEIIACEICTVMTKWLAEVHYDTMSEDAENYWIPGTYGGEAITTMEDLFLCALFCVYLFLIMPQKKGNKNAKT